MLKKTKEVITELRIFIEVFKHKGKYQRTPKGNALYRYCMNWKYGCTNHIIDAYEEIVQDVMEDCEINREEAIDLICELCVFLSGKECP